MLSAVCNSQWSYKKWGMIVCLAQYMTLGLTSSLACLRSLSRTHLKACFCVGRSFSVFCNRTLGKLLQLFRIVSGNTECKLCTLCKMLIPPLKHPT